MGCLSKCTNKMCIYKARCVFSLHGTICMFAVRPKKRRFGTFCVNYSVFCKTRWTFIIMRVSSILVMSLDHHWVTWLVLGLCIAGAMGGDTAQVESTAQPTTGFYTDDGLQQTVILEGSQISRQHQEEIQQEILAILGLTNRPEPLPHPRQMAAPRYMLQLYNYLLQDSEDNLESLRNKPWLHLLENLTMGGMAGLVGKVDLIMSFINQVERRHLQSDGGRLFYFDANEVPASETVAGAELRMYKKASPWLQGRDPITIRVYQLIQGREPQERVPVLEETLNVSSLYEGWLYANVTRTTLKWTQDPESNRGIYITLTDSFGYDLDPQYCGLVGNEGEEDKQVFMVAFFREEQHLRVRRRRSATRTEDRIDQSHTISSRQWSSYYHPENSRETQCQRKTFYVNFRDLGWQDWIIAPEAYSAYYCAGQCNFPLSAEMNATNHAIVQTLAHLMDPENVPLPCCAPTEMASVSVLHYDDNSNVILKKFRNMVAKACGCQ